MKVLSLVVSTLTMAAATAVSLRGQSASADTTSETSKRAPSVLLGEYASSDVMTQLHELSRRRKHNRRKRGTDDGTDQEGEDGSLAGRLVIAHADLGYMSEDKLDAEADLIEQSFVDAYNEAHPDGDFKMTSMTLLRESLVPEDIPNFMRITEEQMNNATDYLEQGGTRKYDIIILPYPSGTYTSSSWTYRFGWHCRLCREDDMWDYPPAPVSSDMVHSSNHRDFEDTFCMALKKSDLEEFQPVKDCSIVFSQHDNDALTLNEERLDVYRRQTRKPNADDEDATGQGFLVMEYVDLDKREDLAREVAKVEAAFVAAYNDAHNTSDFEMVSMTMTDESEIPVPDMLHALTYPNYWVNNVWWRYNFGYHCRFCREDDMWDYPPRLDAAIDALDMDSPALKSAHLDFEKIFCRILKHSKLGEFTNVDNCSIFFEYNKNGKGKGNNDNPPVEVIEG